MTCMAQFLLPLSFIAKVIAISIAAAYWLMKSTNGRKPSKSGKNVILNLYVYYLSLIVVCKQELRLSCSLLSIQPLCTVPDSC